MFGDIRHCNKTRTIGNLVTSCNSFILLKLAWAYSHIYHFHWMMDCWQASPTLWFGRSDNAHNEKFRLCSNLVTHYQISHCY